MEKPSGLCVNGLGLFINWGMALVAITVFGQNTQAARITAQNAQREFDKHQHKCPVCKPVQLEDLK